MTKLCKKLVVASVIAFCFAVCMCLFGACAGNKPTQPEDDSVKYTVTVQIDETTPASGVKVQIRKGGATFESKNTDDNGKAEFDLSPDSYDVALSTLPDHYSVPENASLSLTAESRDLTVTLEKNFAYIVKLVNPDGTPYYAEGVEVLICTIPANGGAGNCLPPVALEKGGIATLEYDKDNYHVKLEGLPSNAIFECDADGYYTGENFSAEKTEMTITVYTVNSVNAKTPMTDAEKTAFANECLSYTADNALTAYYFKTTLAKGKAAYYSITAEFDGDYLIYKKNGESSNYLFNGTAFTLANEGSPLYTFPHMQAGKTYYFQVYNNGETPASFEFVVEAPAASYTQTSILGEFDVTIAKEGASATIEYTPAIGAAFKLTGPADIDTSIILQTAAEDGTHGTFSKNATCTARFTEDRLHQGDILNFWVAADGVSQYPVSFKVKLEKTADLKNATAEKRATATLSQYAEQEGELTYVPFDGTVVYNATDKLYHLNTEDGPVVVVSLNAALASSRFKAGNIEAKLAYIDMDANSDFELVVETTANKASLTEGNTYNDYRLMLRGFKEYESVPNYQGGNDIKIPTDIKEESYYVKYVNKDGVYPLTDELKAFLEEFVKVYADRMPADAVQGNEWLFACCYYTQGIIPPADTDVIVGTYTYDGTTLTVNADGTCTYTSFGTTDGTWKKNEDGTYTFTEDFGFEEATYSVTRNPETGALTVVDDNDDVRVFELPGAGDDEDEDAIVGEYNSADGATLKVNADGTYEMNVIGNPINGTWIKTPRGTYTFMFPSFDGDIAYFVDFNAETGALKFYDLEGLDPDTPIYEFVVPGSEGGEDEPDVVVGYYPSTDEDSESFLSVNEESIFSIFVDDNQTLNGTWYKNDGEGYTFTVISEDENVDDVEYYVELDEEGVISFYDLINDFFLEHPIYRFKKFTLSSN